MSAVGVDACKKGWIAVELRDDGGMAAHFLARIEQLDELMPDAEVVGVDIPIELPVAGRRQADVQVRQRLVARRSGSARRSH